MRAGQLRHRIKIQTPVIAADSYSAGSNISSWNDVYRGVRAGIFPLRSKEGIENEKIETELTHRVRIRYRTGIIPKMRILFKKRGTDRVFRIKSVVNVRERNKILDLICVEEI